ncbi:MAG: hypothetical protein ACK417_05205 [Bacteroidia bacterium]
MKAQDIFRKILVVALIVKAWLILPAKISLVMSVILAWALSIGSGSSFAYPRISDEQVQNILAADFSEIKNARSEMVVGFVSEGGMLRSLGQNMNSISGAYVEAKEGQINQVEMELLIYANYVAELDKFQQEIQWHLKNQFQFADLNRELAVGIRGSDYIRLFISGFLGLILALFGFAIKQHIF